MICLAIKRTHGCRDCVEVERLRFVSPPFEVQIKAGLTAPPDPITLSHFLNGSELLTSLCTRHYLTVDNLGPKCHYRLQALQCCSESRLHPRLCCWSASEATLSSTVPPGFRDAPRPLREENDTHIVLLQLPRFKASPGLEGFELLSDKKEYGELCESEWWVE